MSKYDFKIDLSTRTSTGLILSMIEPGSVVLEFGCATGRMTRYMKEEMSCQVYIVEYDDAAYETALEYAQGGLCGDIENMEWVRKFEGVSFDAIIFADVLEHLSDPEKTVRAAAGLLKENGNIFISVPNVTHNDILLKAYDERFDYTETGLLDNMHVHFWGLKNIEEMAKNCGLGIKNVSGTYCDTGLTEQYENMDVNRHLLLKNVLRERICGEVYQFVFSLCKDRNIEPNVSLKSSIIMSHLYFDTGKGYNPAEFTGFESVLTSNGSYHAHYKCENLSDLQGVRFDPIEGQGCIVRNLALRQGDEVLTYTTPLGVKLEDGLLFVDEDPQLYIEFANNGESVTVDADIYLIGENYLNILRDEYLLASDKLGEISERNSQLEIKVAALEDKNDQLSEKLYNSGLELAAYSKVSNGKDVYTLELEREVQYLRNLEVVRLRARVVRGLRKIWGKVKRIIGKGEQ